MSRSYWLCPFCGAEGAENAPSLKALVIWREHAQLSPYCDEKALCLFFDAPMPPYLAAKVQTWRAIAAASPRGEE